MTKSHLLNFVLWGLGSLIIPFISFLALMPFFWVADRLKLQLLRLSVVSVFLLTPLIGVLLLAYTVWIFTGLFWYEIYILYFAMYFAGFAFLAMIFWMQGVTEWSLRELMVKQKWAGRQHRALGCLSG